MFNIEPLSSVVLAIDFLQVVPVGASEGPPKVLIR